MDAYDFSTLRNTVGNQFSFGMDNQKAAYILRQLADKLDGNELALQSCKVLTTASIENFAMTTLRITFHERRKESDIDKLVAVERKLDTKRLYAPGSSFPVATAKVK